MYKEIQKILHETQCYMCSGVRNQDKVTHTIGHALFSVCPRCSGCGYLFPNEIDEMINEIFKVLSNV